MVGGFPLFAVPLRPFTYGVEITVARNKSTETDIDQAQFLRKVFEKHFFDKSTFTSLNDFRNDYLTTINTWGDRGSPLQ